MWILDGARATITVQERRESILDHPSLRHETCNSFAATPTDADSIKMSPTHCNRLVPSER